MVEYPTVTVAQVQKLPRYHQRTIPPEFLDAMGHMNIRHYVGTFDEAAWPLWVDFGMNEAYIKEHHSGAFALEQHIRYLNEVLVDETVSVFGRVLGVRPKLVHFMLFMVNDTRQNVAATFEVLGAHADIKKRRISNFPDFMSVRIAELITAQNQLGWSAPICGALGFKK